MSASVVDPARVLTGPGIPAATPDRFNYVVEIDNPSLHPHEVEIEIKIEGAWWTANRRCLKSSKSTQTPRRAENSSY
jgi:hypothetical protein